MRRISMRFPYRFSVACAKALGCCLQGFALVAALGLAPGAQAQPASDNSPNARLLVASREGNVAQVEQLLKEGAAPNSRNRLGKTPLLMAGEKGNLALAELMLKAGADVNQASLEGVTPLMAASYGGHHEVVQRLLEAGARTDPQDRMHKCAMVYA